MTETLPSTRSDAVGGTYETVAELVEVDPVVLVADEVKEGGVVSTTITLKESTTSDVTSSVHVTGVMPIGKREFGAGLHVAPAGAVKSTFAPPGPVASRVMSLLVSQCIADADGVSVSARKRMKTSRRPWTFIARAP